VGLQHARTSCWRRAVRAFIWARCLVASLSPACDQCLESFSSGGVLGLDADSVLDALKQSL
jgi:hypothetical protein